jgi:poly-gamma-glutamate synthesis protein (capsule biosynthesis protein)
MRLKFILIIIVIAFASGMGASVYMMENSVLPETSPIPDIVAKILPSNIPEEKPVKLIFTGDIMLGRNVESLMIKNGLEYPFLNISNFFKNSDGVVINLEGPISESEGHIRTKTGEMKFSFLNDVGAILKNNNVVIANLANNHLYDKGVKLVDNTKKVLSENGISYMGDSNKITKDSLLNIKIGGKDFAFIGFNATYPSFKKDDALGLIASASAGEDIVIVNIHWGQEYKMQSDNSQKELARAFIDNGADIVIGHHPHVVQEAELYKDRPIFYSLGNFIFDQYFSKETQEGLALTVSFLNNKMVIDLNPVSIKNSQPVLMAENDKGLFLKSLADRSAPNLRDFIISGNISY